jgi:LuxR family quorum sensing-dependent transcriptional regulator
LALAGLAKCSVPADAAMTKILAIYDVIDSFSQINASEKLIEAYQNLIQQFGFKVFCIGDVGSPHEARPNRVWAGSWPDGWAKMFQEKNFAAVDPVVHQMLVQHTGFRWRDVRKRVSGVAAEVMDSARDFSMNEGFGIPVHSRSGGKIIGVSMAGPESTLDSREEASLHLATIYFEARLEALRNQEAKDLTQPKDIAPSIIKLTTRERDCLSWVASGKTDWEIGQILGISATTTKEYVNRAMHKLDSVTRAQAVARAIQLYQISI